MNMKIEAIREGIAVLKPLYNDQGDICEIITESGESFHDRRSIKSVRRALARNQALDFAAQGAIVSRMLGRGGILPFYLDNSRIYVPFNMRKPLAANDYCYGYVRLDQITDIEKCQDIPHIRLSNGRLLQLNSTLSGARQNLEMGRRLAGMLGSAADEEELLLQAVKVILAWLKK